MKTRHLLVSLACLFLALSWATPSPAAAQVEPGTDLAALTEAGAAVDMLASEAVTVNSTIVAGTTLRLSRVVPPASDELPLIISEAPELWYVEQGSIRLISDSGARLEASAGEQLVIRESGQYTLELSGDSCPSALRLELTAVLAMRIGSDEAAPRLGPNGEACPTGGVLANVGEPISIRPDPATAVIARVSWTEMTFASNLAFSGPAAYAVEAGTLVVSSDAGVAAGIGLGSWIAIPSGLAHSAAGQDGTPVTALLVGAFAGGSLVLPTPDATEPAGVQGQSYLSPTYGYRLTWDESWSVVGESSDGIADSLQLTNGTSNVYLQASPYAGDARTCIDDVIANMSAQPGFSEVELRETADGRPLIGGDERRRFAVAQFLYTTESGSTQYTEYVECRTLPASGAVVIVTQIVLSELYAREVDAINALSDALELP